jgi:hypothetical protein
MTDVELLRAAIVASGLSARRFAVEVLLRDERTCRRWLAGDSPIPAPVRAFLIQSYYTAGSGASRP